MFHEKINGKKFPCSGKFCTYMCIIGLTVVSSVSKPMVWSLHECFIIVLTHWGRDKMAAISQTTLSNAFSWMKIFSIKISLKFVPKGPINNIPTLVQIMTWRRPGDKPLSEPMMVSLMTHICVTRPQRVNISRWIHCSSSLESKTIHIPIKVEKLSKHFIFHPCHHFVCFLTILNSYCFPHMWSQSKITSDGKITFNLEK